MQYYLVCFSTSRPANHAICSFIDSSGYASGPIRRCLVIDYIIKMCLTPKYDFFSFLPIKYMFLSWGKVQNFQNPELYFHRLILKTFTHVLWTVINIFTNSPYSLNPFSPNFNSNEQVFQTIRVQISVV